MPPIRPAGPVHGWWSPNYRPSTLSAELPVTAAQPLWRLVKDGHSARLLQRVSACRLDGLIMDRVVGGKVQERWEQFDQLLMLQQLGFA